MVYKSHYVSITCPSCGHEEEVLWEGGLGSTQLYCADCEFVYDAYVEFNVNNELKIYIE